MSLRGSRVTGASSRSCSWVIPTPSASISPSGGTPFSAARDGAHIYGRGTLDDKDSVTASLMAMLLMEAADSSPSIATSSFLPRPARRATTERRYRVHGRAALSPPSTRSSASPRAAGPGIGGDVRYTSVQTAGESSRCGIDLVAPRSRGPRIGAARSNAVGASRASSTTCRVAAAGGLNEHDRAYFARLGDISDARGRAPYRAVLSSTPSASRRSTRGCALTTPSRLDAADLGLADHLQAAIASTSSRPRRLRASMCACCPGEDPRFLELG